MRCKRHTFLICAQLILGIALGGVPPIYASAQNNYGKLSVQELVQETSSPLILFSGTQISLQVESNATSGLLLLRLAQDSSRLRATFSDRQLVSKTLPLTAPELSIEFSVPEVRVQTTFHIELVVVRQGQDEQILDSLPIQAFPVDPFGSLRAWSKTHRIIVIDYDSSLITFLQKQAISFQKMKPGQKIPADSGLIVIHSEGDERLIQRTLTGSNTPYVALRQGWVLPPVVMSDASERRRINADAELLSKLSSDPQSQLQLLQYIELILGDLEEKLKISPFL